MGNLFVIPFETQDCPENPFLPIVIKTMIFKKPVY